MDRVYQTKLIEDAYFLMKLKGEVALCSTCGSGKTYMANRIIGRYLEEYPTARVLVLAHGLTILRKQFSYHAEVMHLDDIAEHTGGNIPDARIIVSLPQTLRKKKLPKFDLAVVDEAHQFYHAPTVREILDKTNPTCRLLLTGSASKFVKENTPRVMFSMQELRSACPDALSDITTFIVQTVYDFNNNCYNKLDNLREDTVFTEADTKESLSIVIFSLLESLKRNVGWHPETFNGGETFFQRLRYRFVVGEVGKTIIAAANIAQAKQIYSILREGGVSSLLSTSENDVDSEMIAAFKNTDACVLVVVNRGVLGFDMPELRNFVDMSGTENPDIIFQMLGRLGRNDGSQKPKVFIKAASKDRVARTEYVTAFALALTTKEVYETYDGDYINTKYPMLARRIRDTETYNQRDKFSRAQPTIINLDDYTTMLRHLKHRDDDSVAGVAWTTLSALNNLCKPSGYWNNETCYQDAQKYKIRKEWKTASPSAYNAARRLKCFDKCTAHMIDVRNPNGYWNNETCYQDAQKYKTKTEWQRATPSAYSAARRLKCIDKCTAHMIDGCKPNGYWNNETCYQDAQKYKTTTEWQRASPSAYKSARRLKCFDKCTAHMKKRGEK